MQLFHWLHKLINYVISNKDLRFICELCINDHKQKPFDFDLENIHILHELINDYNLSFNTRYYRFWTNDSFPTSSYAFYSMTWVNLSHFLFVLVPYFVKLSILRLILVFWFFVSCHCLEAHWNVICNERWNAFISSGKKRF